MLSDPTHFQAFFAPLSAAPSAAEPKDWPLHHQGGLVALFYRGSAERTKLQASITFILYADSLLTSATHLLFSLPRCLIRVSIGYCLLTPNKNRVKAAYSKAVW